VLGLMEHLQGAALVGDGFFLVPFSTKATRFELPLDDSSFVLDGAGEASRGGDDPVWEIALHLSGLPVCSSVVHQTLRVTRSAQGFVPRRSARASNLSPTSLSVAEDEIPRSLFSSSMKFSMDLTRDKMD